MADTSTLLLLGALGLTTYYLYTLLRQNAAAQRHGCQLPPKRHTYDPCLGFGYKIQDAKSARHGKTLADGEILHRKYGQTFRESSIFGTTIKTASEENIHTIFGLKAEDWGVKPFRYEGFRPFCGEGVLSTDGPAWEHSRTLLRPFFYKSNISDLTNFEHLVEQLLERLPRDGSTVDLVPHFSNLVYPSSLVSIYSLLIVGFQSVENASQFVLGESLGLLSEDEPKDIPVSGEAFSKAFQLSLMGCGLRMFLGLFRILVPRSITTQQWQIVHKFFDFYVDKALLRMTNEEPDPLQKRPSVLNTLVHQTTDRHEIRNQAIHAMVAAQDTTPTLLSNTLFCLSRSPDVWDRLRAEVASVGANTLTIEEATNFELLRNILNECMRPTLSDLHDFANSDGCSSSAVSGLSSPRPRCPCRHNTAYRGWPTRR